MEIEIGGGLRVKINQKDCTSFIIESPEATGNVFIPQFAVYEGEKYNIISIKENAFTRCIINSLTFPEDSKVETLEANCFRGANIKQLQIPPSVKYLQNKWCNCLLNLNKIEVSPSNPHFILYNNEFLLGKTDEKSDTFDVLYFATNNIKDAVIPPQIKVIKEFSFYNHLKLQSVTFDGSSNIKIIEDNVFANSFIKKFELPASLEKICDNCFANVVHLTQIEVSSENIFFKVVDGQLLLEESKKGSGVFDVILFARRDIESVNIPSYIKRINNSAFEYCRHLQAVTFEPNSSLEKIGTAAFYDIEGQERIVLPPSLKTTSINSFSYMKNVKYIDFLGKSVKIGISCFMSCNKLSAVTIPNADNITLDGGTFSLTPDDAKLFVKRSAKISGNGLNSCKERICYIEEDDSVTVDDTIEKVTTKSEDNPTALDNHFEKDYCNLKKFVHYLRSHFEKYENVISYEDFVNELEKGEIEDNRKDEDNDANLIPKHEFVGPEDEEFHEIVSKIGEGATSEVFKVVDKRTGEVICKKIVKECNDESAFTILQNSMKEIDFSLSVKHPCICEAFGYNLQEPLQKIGDETGKTTIALFFELLQYSVKDVIAKGLMNNTLKVRIAVEVAFGMSHIHSLGMMHRDLKLENIMMNDVFNSKIIDFGLIHIPGFSGTGSNLTKGIGTLAYMSPEMLNEEEYDNKTDVYSFGVVLFALFTGSLPKQSMRDRMNNVQMEYPEASNKISEYGINLIKHCTSFEPSKRPTFDEIIDDMAVNKFALAPEVDIKIITLRYQELNRLKILYTKKGKE